MGESRDARTAGAGPGEANACRCVSCATCRGTGSITVDMGGHVISTRMDDLDIVEPCDDCGGTGITEECDACREAWEQDHDEDGL